LDRNNVRANSQNYGRPQSVVSKLLADESKLLIGAEMALRFPLKLKITCAISAR
jgi:hypothetical protein